MILVVMFATLLGTMEHLRPVPNEIRSFIPPPRPVDEITLDEILAAPPLPDDIGLKDYQHIVDAQESYRRWEKAWIAVSILDLATTAYALHRGASEANPVLNSTGIHPSVASGALTVGVTIPINRWSKRDPWGARTVLRVMTAVRGAVVLNNLNVLREMEGW